MAMVKWDPLRELQSMQEEMNRLFELSRSRLRGGPLEEGLWQPPVDIYEDDQEIVVKMEAPEVKLEDITINIEDERLIIEGVRPLEFRGEQLHYHRLERSYGHFRRLFALPAPIDQDRLTASCEHGVLKVILPKKNPGGGLIEERKE